MSKVELKIPPKILLGSNSVEAIPDFTAPCNVTSSRDLPLRFFLGDLVPESFEQTEAGWKASYQDAEPDVGCEVTYERSSGRLCVAQKYHGPQIIYVGPAAAAAEFSCALQGYSVFPEAWGEIFQSRVTNLANVHWPTCSPEIPTSSGFPDGVYKTIFLPVPISKLMNGLDFMAKVSADRRIKTGVRAVAILGHSFVNYVVGKIPASYLCPKNLCLRVSHETGLPLYDLPELQTAPDGSQAVTVIRQHYTLRIECFFRDVERLVLHLKGCGLLGKQKVEHELEGFPDSVEYSGFVAPLGAELLVPKAAFWDGPRTRRMVYPQESVVEPEKTTKDNFDLDAAHRSIRAAEKVAEKISRAHLKALARVKGTSE